MTHIVFLTHKQVWLQDSSTMVRRDPTMSGEERLITAKLGAELRVLLDKPLPFLPCSDFFRREKCKIFTKHKQNLVCEFLKNTAHMICNLSSKKGYYSWFFFLSIDKHVLACMCVLLTILLIQTLEILFMTIILSINDLWSTKTKEHSLIHFMKKYFDLWMT